MDKRLKKIEEQMEDIMFNHLPHIKENLAKINSNLDWLQKFLWLIISTSVASLIINLIK